MIRADIYSQNIDYNTLVEISLPYIEKGLTDKDNPFFQLAAKVISKNGKPSRFSRFVLSVLPKKDDMLAFILTHYEDTLVEYLNSQLTVNNIAARIASLKIDTIERNSISMLRIEIKMDEIDYEKTIDNLLPQMIQRLSEKEDKSGKIGRILLDLKDIPAEAMKAAIGVIPLNQRDNLAAAILSEYQEELTESMNVLLDKNNIKAEISAINIESI